ncbi:protein containg Winged helix DNA-binding domain [Longilinea arvoryzae]|uniref:Protein containg Winged helix DNA-binding domain n=1 Tax=Longilinea arvoryzae TaxID=360412 RepID=A0A0S7BAC6_9CHLR|nr:crosslink repair DNA glycosylase YcaQ family protein [Longilinea arvoryzae]GAP14455.1 protein containg Winged helix DNA-binding domain [Longilinea arvoryzae]
MISISLLNQYRSQTFNMAPGMRLTSAAEAVNFVNRRGFVTFWPVKGIVMPSLWAATAGDRPVADEHDDPGHITWGWKDELLPQKVWYYARVLRRRNTMISLEALPYFYALSPNYGDPENDYLDQYQQGLMTNEARQVYETLLHKGPLDTLSLRKEAHLTGSDSRFNRALEDLQIEFKVLPVGVVEAGAWRYAFQYEIVPRHFPELIDQAGKITEPQARRWILERYFNAVGAVPRNEVVKLFGWRLDAFERTLTALLKDGVLTPAVEVEGSSQPHLALTSFVDGI